MDAQKLGRVAGLIGWFVAIMVVMFMIGVGLATIEYEVTPDLPMAPPAVTPTTQMPTTTTVDDSVWPCQPDPLPGEVQCELGEPEVEFDY